MKNKEPLVHLVKRSDISSGKAWIIRGIAILASLVFCGLLTLAIAKVNPIKLYSAMFEGNFGSKRRIWVLLSNISALLGLSIAVTPAFKMRCWNLGAEGQCLAGALATTACMILLGGKVANPLLWVIMLVSAVLAGAIWGFIPAFFKARYGTNETLFTLMMNYVATQLVAYFIVIWETTKGSANIGVINQRTEAGWLPVIGGQRYLLNVLIIAALTIFMFIYLKYTKHGYEIDVVGESEKTARYIGINVRKVIMRTMLLSGAICGVCGWLLVGSTNHTLTTSLTSGYGFTAVMVSWLSRFDPLIMIFSSFLLIFMNKGASEVASSLSLNESYGDILTGIVLFFLIGCEFFINYRVIFRKKNAEVSEKKEA